MFNSSNLLRIIEFDIKNRKAIYNILVLNKSYKTRLRLDHMKNYFVLDAAKKYFKKALISDQKSKLKKSAKLEAMVNLSNPVSDFKYF
jgi:hypothetical protein